MKNNNSIKIPPKSTWNINNNSQSGNAVYILGFVGAIVYYFQNSGTFWLFVLGFLKALVWPAMIVHKLLESMS